MTKEQKEFLNKIQNNFDRLWDGLCKLIPELNQLFSKKELLILKKKYLIKSEALFEKQQEQITAPCLFDDYISSNGTGNQSKEFIEEINFIGSSIKKALNFANSTGDMKIYNKIKKIIKELIITMDEDPSSKNPDYRNRVNEIITFNMLMECDEVDVTDIAYKLGNGKDCDFRCISKDGSELLIEVMSIHNIDLNKQDDAKTFSDFIKKKIHKKYDDKTKGLLNPIDNLRILPILEYNERIADFNPTIDSQISLSAFTVIKNRTEEKEECILLPIENLKK